VTTTGHRARPIGGWKIRSFLATGKGGFSFRKLGERKSERNAEFWSRQEGKTSINNERRKMQFQAGGTSKRGERLLVRHVAKERRWGPMKRIRETHHQYF